MIRKEITTFVDRHAGSRRTAVCLWLLLLAAALLLGGCRDAVPMEETAETDVRPAATTADQDNRPTATAAGGASEDEILAQLFAGERVMLGTANESAQTVALSIPTMV